MSITYKGIEYPTREITVILSRSDYPSTLTLAPESLFDAFGEYEEWSEEDGEACAIDQKIWEYIEDVSWNLSDAEIVATCLNDGPHQLVTN